MALMEFQEIDRRTRQMVFTSSPTVDEFLDALVGDAGFRTALTDALASLPFAALRWETPMMTNDTLEEEFEAVVVDSPSLERRQDPSAFEDQFAAHDEDVLTVPNLRGDAMLVIPRPLTEARCYCHLASFLRGAPEAQTHALWVAVGLAVRDRVGSKPMWLSTAGGGVPWLHVRLDNRPKYYAHGPYRG
jgi:hypothetical protein